MPEAHTRITDTFCKILPPEELMALDARRAVVRALSTPNWDGIDFRDTDPPEFRTRVKRNTDALKRLDPNNHILFQDISEERRQSPLREEMLYWDIKSDAALDPKAAEAILEQYGKIENMPPDMHQLNFPLFMFGYMLGHSIRVAIYSALLAQEVNKDGVGYKVDPVLAATAGFWHDIGKLEKQQKLLAKFKGKYTREQFERIKKHPLFGAIVLKSLMDYGDGKHLPVSPDSFDDVYDVTLKHHVRPDNDSDRSYPYGIPPQDLTPLIQMISLSDAFDAMTTRNYDSSTLVRKHQILRAYEEIDRFKGLQFNPDLAEIFLKMGVMPKDK